MKTFVSLLTVVAGVVMTATPTMAADTSPLITVAPCCLPGASPIVDIFSEKDGWTWFNKSAWTWQGDGEARELHLTEQSGAKPTYRSPFNLAWYELKEYKDFTLTCEAQMTHFTKGNNDLCFAFGKMDEYKFYYAHIGQKADKVHHQIHVVDNADRKAITVFRSAGMEWKQDHWHYIKIVRNSENGDIAVYVDHQEQPVLTAQDKTLSWGKIGLGSFDDLGKFRNVKVQGISREPQK